MLTKPYRDGGLAPAEPDIRIMAAEHLFTSFLKKEESTWHIREDGRIWKEKNL